VTTRLPVTCQFPPLLVLNDLESIPSAPSASGAFLRELFRTGEVRVPIYSKGDWEFDAGTNAVLQEWDVAARAELAGEAPALDIEAASWAARQLFKACQCLVDRDVDAALVSAELTVACRVPRRPSTDYSVDLIYRFLPDLVTLSRRLAPNDALTDILAAWAHEWPLSSPGVGLSGSVSLEGFIHHPALRRLYVDRVTALIAKDRINHADVRRWLHADLAAYPSLAPLLFEALNLVAPTLPAPDPVSTLS
jgi:hypothetical protein